MDSSRVDFLKDLRVYETLEKKPECADKPDMVNHPPHYQSESGIECIDSIHAALGDDGFVAYCRGNAMKYTWRQKIDPAEDMRKAAWYLNKAAEVIEAKHD